MKKFHTLLLAMMSAVLFAACATTMREMPVAYDLGPLEAERAALLPATPAFLLPEAQASDWLDGTSMHYRLSYANNQQAHAYAHSRWSMKPAKLLEQRLKARIAAAGGVALPSGNGGADGILLRLELEDFSQRFDTAESSTGQVTLRVSAFRGRLLLGQKTFTRTVPATSPNAAGGAKAIASASDGVIGDMLVWLAGLGANG